MGGIGELIFFAENRGCSGIARGKLRLWKGVDEVGSYCWRRVRESNVRNDEPAVVGDDENP